MLSKTQSTAWLKGSPGAMGITLEPSKGRFWQPRPIPPHQPEAGQTEGTGAAPFLGIPGTSDTLGCRPAAGPGSWGTRLSREGLWGPGDQPCLAITGTGADSPGRLTWAPELWVGWGGLRVMNTGCLRDTADTTCKVLDKCLSWVPSWPGQRLWNWGAP